MVAMKTIIERIRPLSRADQTSFFHFPSVALVAPCDLGAHPLEQPRGQERLGPGRRLPKLGVPGQVPCPSPAFRRFFHVASERAEPEGFRSVYILSARRREVRGEASDHLRCHSPASLAPSCSDPGAALVSDATSPKKRAVS